MILVALVIIYSFISSRTVFGRHVYAVGGNKHAAELSGVKTKKINFLVMMNMSMLAALAGMIFVARSTASGPFDGVNWELDAIAAVFIGGAAVSGGVGTVTGSIIGGLVMAVLNNGLQLLGVGADMTQMIKGLVLLIAVAFDVFNKSQGKPSISGLITRAFRRQDPVKAEPSTTRPDPPPTSTPYPGSQRRTRNQEEGTHAQDTQGAPRSDRRQRACADRLRRKRAGAVRLAHRGAAAGFAADSLIGVALPQKTSENWVLAENLFKTGLGDAGFKFDVQFANGGVSEQQNQIQAMVTNGAKVIVVGAIDGSQLGTQLQAAKDAGATIIAYDRLVKNTEAVDFYVAYDNFKVGVLQGTALLDGLKERKGGSGPWNIELIAGSPDDANSQVFFDGAMSILQPEIDKGTLVVVSGQTTFQQVATQGWKAENVQKRMDTILSASYSGDTELHGILSPNDTLARAAMTSVRSAGKELPVVTGQDSEVESVKSIVAGEQYSTIYKDTTALVEHTITMVSDLQQGKTPEVNDDKSYDNGVKIVPAFLLEPVIVTQANAAEVYANDKTLGPLTKG
nr:substrate-binding domain-containing protein [Tessaracoccus coleopterorum]